MFASAALPPRGPAQDPTGVLTVMLALGQHYWLRPPRRRASTVTLVHGHIQVKHRAPIAPLELGRLWFQRLLPLHVYSVMLEHGRV